MNESFNYKTTYKFLKESNILKLNNIKEFKNFYHFGNPISLIPNEDIKYLNLKFQLFRDINTYLGKRTGKKISKDDFHEVIFQKNDDFHEILNLIKFAKDISNDERKQIMHEVRVKIDKVSEQLKIFRKDSFEINYLTRCINSNDIEAIKEKQKIEETYFKTFEKTFINLDKPVVGVYNSEKKEVEILSPSFIIKESRTERFLDIKEISHNSPTYVKVGIGTIFANTLMRMGNNVLAKIKGTDSETIYDEKLAKEINEINELLDYKELVDEMKQVIIDEKLNCNEEIENQYLKNIVGGLKKNTEDKVIDTMQEYKFEYDKL
ncbi:hypothetical protein, partial [Cetobacterium sp.]|uniref:hypothetical protein n=1 Tax=Cetobacterium sp. TaxID=2071632 RepID=UPI003EE75FF5